MVVHVFVSLGYYSHQAKTFDDGRLTCIIASNDYRFLFQREGVR